MLAVIPVKLSERLPGKHNLRLGEKTIIELVYEKAARVIETLVYSKIELPVPYIRDESRNIMELVYKLKLEHGAFALIGGDMPFFTESDIDLLLSSFSGDPVTPIGADGEIEPMFSIYAGTPEKTRNLRDALVYPGTVYLDKNIFSKYAFFNINTIADYHRAVALSRRILGKEE